MSSLLMSISILPLLILGVIIDDGDARIAALLTEARKALAPDKRTAVFNIEGSVKRSSVLLKGELQSESLKEKLLTFIRQRENLTIEDSIIVLPHPSLGGKTFGMVSVSVANIRTKPGHAEELATQAILGTPLRILKREEGWYYVQTPDEYLGWTDDVIAIFTKDEFEHWTRHPKVIITATYAHVLSSTAKGSDIVSDVVAGNILKLEKEEGKFFAVEYPNGKRGFVAKEYAELYETWRGNADPFPERIISTAKRFMGVPYLWGGTSAKAMDCSGFTKTVFFLNGVQLPRDASQQALVGVPVELTEDFKHVKMGDLVFFGRKATAERPERVTHVGIYIDNYKFIHEGGDVRINSFSPNDPDYSEYRTRTLLGVRRVIGVGEEHGVRRINAIPYYRNDVN